MNVAFLGGWQGCCCVGECLYPEELRPEGLGRHGLVFSTSTQIIQGRNRERERKSKCGKILTIGERKICGCYLYYSFNFTVDLKSFK